MKLNLALPFFVLLFLPNLSTAQIDWISIDHPDIVYSELDTVDFPAELPDITDSLNWSTALNNAMEQLYEHPANASIGYMYWCTPGYRHEGQKHLKAYREAMTMIANSETLSELFYGWAVPYWEEAFKAMHHVNQEEYVRRMNVAVDFVETMDLKALKKQLKKDPKGFVRQHGDQSWMKAFLFRRIHSKDVSKKTLLRWLKRLRNDMESWITKGAFERSKTWVSELKEDCQCKYVLNEELWGVYDQTNQALLEPQFKAIAQFNAAGVAFVRDKQGKYGVLRRNWTFAVKPQWQSIGEFEYGIALVSRVVYKTYPKGALQGEEAGYYDEFGDWIEYPEDENGNVQVMLGTYYGFVKEDGSILIPANYSYDLEFELRLLHQWSSYFPNDISFKKGYIILKDTAGAFGVINQSGKTILPFQYQMIKSTADGQLWAYQGGTRKVEVAYEVEYYEGGKWQLFDASGNLSLKDSYDVVGKFIQGYYRVTNDGQEFWLHPDGTVLTPSNPEYNAVNKAYLDWLQYGEDEW